jgi:predicted DNA-binding transcriptional regulator YafY
MKITANTRIQWFHKELTKNTYPNAAQMAEWFHISHRQAQRDIDMMKKKLGAPLAYDQHQLGYYYTEPFSLPLLMTAENDSMPLQAAPTRLFTQQTNADLPEADNVLIQSQIPYTAVLEIRDRLTILEMRSYIISEQERHRFLCEFHNIDRFLCAVLLARSEVRIVEPSWLRGKLVQLAQKVIDCHRALDEDDD